MRYLISNNCAEGAPINKSGQARDFTNTETWIKQQPSYDAMIKGASIGEYISTRPAAQAALGFGLGAANGAAFGSIDIHETPEVRRRNMIRNAIYEGTLAALAAPVVGGMMPKSASWFSPEPSYDRQADAYRAKANYSRVKLRLGSSFKKLSPDEQAELLAAHDAYHNQVEGSIRSGGVFEKSAYDPATAYDFVDKKFVTPSVFPENHKGEILTLLKAAKEGDAHAIMVLSALRGKEGSPEYNMAINQIIAMQKAREVGSHGAR